MWGCVYVCECVSERACVSVHVCEHMWVVCICVCSYICMCEREGAREHRRGRRRERKREMEDQFFHVSCPGTGRKTMAGHQGHICLWFSPAFCFVSLLICGWWPLSQLLYLWSWAETVSGSPRYLPSLIWQVHPLVSHFQGAITKQTTFYPFANLLECGVLGHSAPFDLLLILPSMSQTHDSPPKHVTNWGTSHRYSLYYGGDSSGHFFSGCFVRIW